MLRLQLLTAFYRNVERLQSVLTCVDTLAIFERNERSVDVLYRFVTKTTYRRNTSSSKIFSGQVPDLLAKGSLDRYTYNVRESIDGLTELTFQARAYLSGNSDRPFLYVILP